MAILCPTQMFLLAFAYVMISSDKIYFMWWCEHKVVSKPYAILLLVRYVKNYELVESWMNNSHTRRLEEIIQFCFPQEKERTFILLMYMPYIWSRYSACWLSLWLISSSHQGLAMQLIFQASHSLTRHFWVACWAPTWILANTPLKPTFSFLWPYQHALFIVCGASSMIDSCARCSGDEALYRLCLVRRWSGAPMVAWVAWALWQRQTTIVELKLRRVQGFCVCKCSDTTQFCSSSWLMYIVNCCIRSCILCR